MHHSELDRTFQYRKYAPKCSVCDLLILPEPGKEESTRVVALDRNFHITCYKCEVIAHLLSKLSKVSLVYRRPCQQLVVMFLFRNVTFSFHPTKAVILSMATSTARNATAKFSKSKLPPPLKLPFCNQVTSANISNNCVYF